MGQIRYNDIPYSGGGGSNDNSIILSQAEYNALPQAEKEDTTKIYYIYDAVITSAEIDDTTTALDKVWSSQKTSTELADKVDKVSGKGLSENDYTNTDKTIVDGVSSALADKVDKINGKGLSTEDYTTAEKTKLSGIADGAEVNVQSDWNQNDSTADDFIKNKPTIPPGVVVDQTYNASSTNAQSGTAVAQAVTIKSISVNGVVVTIDANKNADIEVITKTVNDLQNYYLKSETYTKTEVDNLISAISSIAFEVVSSLPTTNIKTNVIYLVPSSDPQTQNVKDEYINLDGTTSGWEKIGSTDIDLSGYLKTTDVGTAAFKDVPTTGDANNTQVVMGNDSRLTDSRTPTSHTHTKSQITDFPTLGTAAYKDVPSSGNASTTQVVMGTDTRLTDARNAADVSAWAKAANKPTYTASEVGAIATSQLGVANGVATLDANGKVTSSQIQTLSSAEITTLEGLTND